MKTRVTVKKFAVAEKMFSSCREGGTNEKFINPPVTIITQTDAKVNKRMPSGHVIYCCLINILLLLHNRY